jgi:hypothetical protein
MEKQVFQIPDCNLANLQDQVGKLQKRAAKLGSEPIVLQILGHTDKVDNGAVYRVHQVTVTGEAPRMNGWGFAAKLEHLREGNVMKAVPGYDLEERFRTAAPWCDHCQTRRNRKDTYVVQDESGKQKQVGSSCLADFTGHKDPAGVVSAAELIIEAVEACEGFETINGGGPTLLQIEDYLTQVVAEIRCNGWVSRSKALDRSDSTADQALNQIFGRAFIEPRNRIEPSAKDWETAQAALKWARTELTQKETPNDYEWNLLTACAEDVIPYELAGIVASLIPAYNKAQERKIQAGRSDYQGAVGERQLFDGLEVVGINHLDGLYGVTVLHRFQDASENVYVWFSSGSGAELDMGRVYSGKATVKDHKEYRGIKQTILTRCKFEEVQCQE